MSAAEYGSIYTDIETPDAIALTETDRERSSDNRTFHEFVDHEMFDPMSSRYR